MKLNLSIALLPIFLALTGCQQSALAKPNFNSVDVVQGLTNASFETDIERFASQTCGEDARCRSDILLVAGWVERIRQTWQFSNRDEERERFTIKSQPSGLDIFVEGGILTQTESDISRPLGNFETIEVLFNEVPICTYTSWDSFDGPLDIAISRDGRITLSCNLDE